MMHNERDIFDDFLRDRLDGLSMDPPRHVWDGLKADLAAAEGIESDAGSTASGDGTKRASGDGADVPPGTFSKSMKMRPGRRGATKGVWIKFMLGAAVIALLATLSSLLGDMAPPSTETRIAEERDDMKTVELAEDHITENRVKEIITFVTPELRDYHFDETGYGNLEISGLDVSDGSRDTDAEPSRKKEDLNKKRKVEKRNQVPEWYAEVEREERYSRRVKHDAGGMALSVSSGLYAANQSGAINHNTFQNVLRSSVSESGVKLFSGMPILESVDHKFPLTFGVDLRFMLTDRVALHGGLSYTYLRSTGYASGWMSGYKVERQLHYVGIPVGVSYRMTQNDNRFDIYVKAGGAVEKAVSARDRSRGGGRSVAKRYNVKGVQTSLNAGIGVDVRLGRKVSLYVEPGIYYYIENSHQPENYRTKNNLTFGAQAGLRFDLK